MLNLNTPIEFTQEEQNTIHTIMNAKQGGSARWNDNRARSIKHRISVHCLEEQRCRCAYCESLLTKGGVQIEHISSKSITPNFVFESDNLVVSCSCCNSPAIKGDKPTIEGNVDPLYSNNSFCIVHPRLDNPDEHIKYQDSDRTLLDISRCSDKGRNTIALFHWDELSAFYTRAANAIIRRNLSVDLTALIIEISTYPSTL